MDLDKKEKGTKTNYFEGYTPLMVQQSHDDVIQ